MWRSVPIGIVLLVEACSPSPAVVPTLAPTSVATSTLALPTSILAAATPTPRPPIAPTATSSPPMTASLPTVETSAPSLGPGFLTPVELDLQFQQPLRDQTELRQLVEGVQQLGGIASVRSDGMHIQVRYDSTRILPGRIRARLTELGHPARAGTDVQNPGDAAD